MRYLLPAVAAATALSIGLAPAAAQSDGHHHLERSRAHVSLHLSTHSVLKGNGLAVQWQGAAERPPPGQAGLPRP